jgi:hypothetical protein
MSQALTSLSAVKAYLGVAGTDDDALLTELIARASDGIVAHCGREFAAADYEEYHDGDGSDSVLLNQRPVIEVLALSDDGVEVAADDHVTYPELGVVRLKSGVFGRGARSVYVSYRAGYETIPGDVEQAAIQWTAELYQGRGAADGREIKSERVGDYAVTYDGAENPGVPAEVRAALEPYRIALARPVR